MSSSADPTPIASASPAPSSAGSPGPPTLAPRTSPALDPAAQCGSSSVVTHKEWVIPPRPKPGRKPATDTPPTKRKAQNRAAQRAFRERRAARVNELEDKLKQVNDEATAKGQGYIDQIQALTRNNAELTRENALYKSELEALRKELGNSKRAKTQVEPTDTITQVASPAPSTGNDAPCGVDCTCKDVVDKALCGGVVDPIAAVPLPRRSDRNKAKLAAVPVVTGPACCGGRAGGDCACAGASSTQKRSTSPRYNSPKRSRLDFLDQLETDFTNAYLPKPSSGAPRLPDPCGFCSDGTPCVCAELATDMSIEDPNTEGNAMKLAPLIDNSLLPTPPPSSGGDSVSKAKKIMPLHPPHTIQSTPKSLVSASSCRPGGCEQCKCDPMSTLFCQSVMTRAGKEGEGCCSGSADCVDIEGRPSRSSTRRESLRKRQVTPPANPGGDENKIFMPCSAVYQALSRHSGFDQASQDLGSLVRPLVVKSIDGSCPEVEVSSVRDVLKMLDRRFGTDS